MANFTHKVEANGKSAVYPGHWDSDRIINDFAKRVFNMPFVSFVVRACSFETLLVEVEDYKRERSVKMLLTKVFTD